MQCPFYYGQLTWKIKQMALGFGKSHDDIKPVLVAHEDGRRSLNHPEIQYIYTDNAAIDRVFLQSIYPLLNRNIAPRQESTSQPPN
jgi:hypothetical protein